MKKRYEVSQPQLGETKVVEADSITVTDGVLHLWADRGGLVALFSVWSSVTETSVKPEAAE